MRMISGMRSRCRYLLVLAGALVGAPALAALDPAPSSTPLPKPSATAAAKPTPVAPLKTPPSRPNVKPQPAAPAAKPGAKTPPPPGSGRNGPRTTDTQTRRALAGGPTFDEAALGADTPELRALAAAERELFPPSQRDLSSPWPSGLPFPVSATEDAPRVHASGLPPAPPPSTPPLTGEGGKDMAWLAKLDLPDLPVRWDARLVRYLEFFKDDPRGRATFTLWHKRGGRYLPTIRKVFRKKSVPEDLAALAMIESGFEPSARSPVGALGMWQFMPDTGKIYGLAQDRWADQRMSITLATEAAADHLADLNRRFGSWDLAMASYNMGYGGVLQLVRRYNTNDFWSLAKLEGSLPWETTLYVPKILAAAIVEKNLAAFGFQDVQADAPLEGEEVRVAPGTALANVASACSCTQKEIEQLNPELRAGRTPPSVEDWPVLVPVEKAKGCSASLAAHRKEAAPTERYVVRFGETLEQIAQTRHVPVAKLVELNAIGTGEVVRGGTVLVVPRADGEAPSRERDAKGKTAEKPTVIVPQDVFVYPDRKRVFYRVQVGDTVRDVCSAFAVQPDEVRRWNDIDPAARLVENMTLQLFVPATTDLSSAVILGENDVHTIVAGTEEFFHHWDEKGRKRAVVTAKSGDTIEAIGKRYGVTATLMERINRRGRSDVLSDGERVVVWTPGSAASPQNPASDGAQAIRDLGKPPLMPEPTPPLPR